MAITKLEPIDGKMYQAVDVTEAITPLQGCRGCAFLDRRRKCTKVKAKCSPAFGRTDGKLVIFKEYNYGKPKQA